MAKKNSNGVLVIPALNPEEKFLDLAVEMAQYFEDVIIVNDGSDEAHRGVFDAIKTALGDRVHLLVHEVNQGKGVALKTAFSYYMESSLKEDYVGLVAADSDGQHEYADVVMLDQKLGEQHERCIHIGHRDLNSKVMPPRSKFGNKLTAFLFNVLYGVKLKDTQTGLRAFSADILPWLVELKGSRFEYEMNMLIHSKNAEIALIEHPIKTKYEENHKSTYSTFKDSFRVGKVLLGPLLFFILAAVAACIVDIGGFALLEEWALPKKGIHNDAISILIATVVPRAMSSVINFLCNRYLTFGGKRISRSSFGKYYLLFFVQMGASYGLVLAFTTLFGGEQVFIKIVVKIVVDLLLSLCSYQVQMRWVFKKKKDKKAKQ